MAIPINIISSPVYIEQIKNFIDKPQVKIITGVRRSGKSTVLRLLKAELLNMGVNKEQVIQINFESFAFSELSTARDLYKYGQEKIQQPQRYDQKNIPQCSSVFNTVLHCNNLIGWLSGNEGYTG